MLGAHNFDRVGVDGSYALQHRRSLVQSPPHEILQNSLRAVLVACVIETLFATPSVHVVRRCLTCKRVKRSLCPPKRYFKKDEITHPGGALARSGRKQRLAPCIHRKSPPLLCHSLCLNTTRGLVLRHTLGTQLTIHEPRTTWGRCTTKDGGSREIGKRYFVFCGLLLLQ